MPDAEPMLLNLTSEPSGPPKAPRASKWDRKRNKSARSKRGEQRGSINGVKHQPTAGQSSMKGYELVGFSGAPPSPKEPDAKVAASEASLSKERAELKQPRKRAKLVPEPQPAGEEREETADGEDLQEAIALSMQRDKKLVTVKPVVQEISSDEEEDAEPGVVSFVDERVKHLPRKRKQEAPPKKLPKKRKGLGTVHPKLGELAHSPAVPQELRDVVFGSETATTFAELGLAQSMSTYLEDIKFTSPTRIQQKCIPVLLAGKDALVEAPTGSGKTLAYLAPIINNLQAEEPRLNRGDGTFSLVVAPTRELSIQINDVLATLLRRYHWLGLKGASCSLYVRLYLNIFEPIEVGGAITGGENRNKEKARLRKGVTVLVATPGRLLDHLQSTAAFHTTELRWLVLDEADRLLDMGFEAKIREILEILDKRLAETGSKRRQTVLLSATMHSKLENLVSLSLQDPISVGFNGGGLVGDDERKAGGATVKSHSKFDIPEQLVQRFIQVGGKQRLVALAGILRGATRGRANCKLVVFMSSCDGVEFHHQLLREAFKHIGGEALTDCPIWKLHGTLQQTERTRTFLEFTNCHRGILLCTDIAARGLDFPAVTSIVQYDPPGEVTEYVHRVGRTARMGQKGEAVLFLLPSEMEYLDLLRQAGVKIRELGLEQVHTALPQPDGKWGRAAPGEPAAAFALHNQLSAAVARDPQMRTLAGDAFRSFVRAYATHPVSLRSVFHVRRLHLGHVAHSFALKDTPTLLGKSMRKAAAKKSKASVKSSKTSSRGKVTKSKRH